MAEKEPANDAEVLDPDQELTLNGVTIVVKEFRMMQGMKVAARVKGLLKAMGALFVESEDAGIDELSDLLVSREDEFLFLLSESTGQPAEWIQGLSDADGQTLLMTFWTVNKTFFINRLLIKRIVTLRREPDNDQQA